MIYLKERCGLRIRPVKIRNQSSQRKIYSKELTARTNLAKQNICASRERYKPFLGPHFESDTALFLFTVIRHTLWSQANSLQ